MLRRARRIRGILGILVAAFIVLGTVAPPVTAAASATSVDTMYSLVNQARFAAGIPGVLRNPSMDVVAEAWANQMGSAGAMSHNPQYSAQIPAGWNRAGENVAEGYPTPQAMFDGWMNSPGHRANILGDYTDIGIAFVSINGKTWGVQDFGKYPGHVTPAAPAPQPAAPAPQPIPPAPQPVAKAPEASPLVPASIPVPEVTPASPSQSPTSSASTSSAKITQRAPSPVVDNASGNNVIVVLLWCALGAVVLLCGCFLLWRRRRSRDHRQA